MASVEKTIDGKVCECFEVGNTGKMRLQLEGTFTDDINRKSLMLVPLSISEKEINKIFDFWLTEQEFDLGLRPGESCTSAEFWVGSDDASKDASITDEFDFITKHVLMVSQPENSLDSKIQAAKQNIYHTSQESKLLFWISAEFEYDTKISLMGRVIMQHKNDDDMFFSYPSIKDALIDWKKELNKDPEEYREEITFIEKLELSSSTAKKEERIAER